MDGLFFICACVCFVIQEGGLLMRGVYVPLTCQESKIDSQKHMWSCTSFSRCMVMYVLGTVFVLVSGAWRPYREHTCKAHAIPQVGIPRANTNLTAVKKFKRWLVHEQFACLRRRAREANG